MNEQELQQAYTRHCEITGQSKMTRTGFEDFKAGFRLGQPAAPVAAGEPVHQWADQDLWMDGDEADLASARAEGFKTRTLWTAPPAAAHGDEAVRKDAERYRWLKENCQDTADDLSVSGQLCFGTYQAGQVDEAIDAAMRAQAGEGGKK